jgi:DUF4097 and DUF4098 domain-containing protein YvlB
MRSRLLTPLILAAATAAAVVPASAQVYPERVPSMARDHALQTREQSRPRRDHGTEEQTERTTRTLRIGENGELDLANIAGNILVTGGSGQAATLEILKTARAQSSDDARALLGLVHVDVTERGGRAEVQTRYPSGDEMRARGRRNINLTVSYTVTAPAGARVTARSVSGDVSARDMRGELSLESVSGNVTVVNGGRVTTAKAVSGNVEITGAQNDGGLEASSVSGTVAVRRSKARRLTLGTVSGNIAVEDVDCGRVELQAVSGNVHFTGALSPGGRYEARSHSGEVRLALSGDTGFALEATSFSGEIRSDLALTGGSEKGDRGRRQQAIRGVYGNGSAVLDLTTFSGSVVISRR